MTRNYQPQEDKKSQTSQIQWGTVPTFPLQWDCVIYPRISTPGQRGNVSSELQLKEDGELWNLAVRCGWKQLQVRHPKEDMELSGTLRMEDRPAFKLMLQWIIQGEVRAVIAVNVDRLFRDKWGTEYSKFMEICAKYHVIVITPDKVYDFSQDDSIRLFREKCVQAWDYLQYQVYKRMIGAKDYLGETGRWAGGNLPPGYIVDRNKLSQTFRRYVPYMPWCPIILRMFERYRELGDSVMAVHREYDAKPCMFPDFEAWIDPEIIAKCKLRKVPGGYTMSLSTMTRMLCNPVYIGWWIYDNAILVDEETGIPKVNHDPIIPVDRQDELFWHTFKQRSPYNIDGTKNPNTIGQRPRRYNQLNSPPNPAMLKYLIAAADPALIVRVQPQYTAKSSRTGKYLYALRVRMNGYAGSPKIVLSTEVVDSVYWHSLMTHLWQASDFTDFAKTEEVQEGNKEAEIQEITEQIGACDRKLAKILRRLTLLEEDKDDNDTQEEDISAALEVEKKLLKVLKTEYRKFTDEKTRLEQRLLKLVGKKPETYHAQMIEYKDLLRQLGDRVREIYSVEELRDIVDTFTTAITLDIISPRVWKLVITWRDPAWGIDEIVSLRIEGNPSISWTPAERELLERHYSSSTRRQLLELLPNRSWVGIRSIASEMKLTRYRDDSDNQFPYDICLADWNAIQQYGLSFSVNSNNLLARHGEDTTCAVGVQYVRSWR